MKKYIPVLMWIYLIASIIAIVLLLPRRGTVPIPDNHTKVNSEKETKEFKAVIDSLQPVIESTKKKAGKKIINVDKKLQQNEKKITYALSGSDSLKQHIADSLFTRP